MRALIKRLFGARLHPWLAGRAVTRLLRRDFGHALSALRGEPLDQMGRPIPWFTYPATEYINQWDLSGKTVFEFGAGNSTLYWCRQGARVVSVENNREWFNRVRAKLPAGAELFFAAEPAQYVQILTVQPDRST